MPLFQHAKQLDLTLARQVADFVEEDGRLVAISNRPICWSTASVNAPFSRPNSSLSISVEGIAAQLTRTMARPAGAQLVDPGREAFLARAVSPRSRTVASVAATWSTCSRTRRIVAALLPTIARAPARDRTLWDRTVREPVGVPYFS